MSGVKLTYILPIINQQIKEVVASEDGKIIYSLVLCHSNARCEELAEFTRELTRFCTDIVDVVIFDQLDFQDVKIDWNERTKRPDEESKNID